MAEDPSNDYVGYGHPPLHSRFQPGRSGNPTGRPKHAKNASTLIANVFAQRIAVRDNGKTRKISKLEASLTQLANKAAGGDIRAILAVISLARGQESREDIDRPIIPLDDADRQVLRRLIERVRTSTTGSDE